MTKANMKVTISKKDLDLVVSRACLAAMTEEGQSEISRANNETRGCVRIKAEGNKISFDSSVSRFSARYEVPVVEGTDSAILVEGETCIPAKELKTVAAKIPDGYKVSMTFIPKPPEQDKDAPAAYRALLPDGIVEVAGIDGKKVIAKAKIEAYPSSQFADVTYVEADKLALLASGKASCFKAPYNAVSFAINPDDLKEIFDKLAVFTTEDSIIFVGADGHRCSIVQSKTDSFDKIVGKELLVPVLIDSEFLSPLLSSLSDKDPLVVGMDLTDHVYFCSEGTSYRISMVTEELRKKFPNYKKIMSLPTSAVVTVDRKHLAFSTNMLMVVNKDRGVHSFNNAEMVIKMVGKGFATVKEATGEIAYELTSQDPIKKDICLHTGYLIEGIKKMSCDKIKMSFTPDEKRVRIEDESDPKFLYYMQVMNSNEA